MTAQASEILIYKGEEFQITSEPLSQFLKDSQKSFKWTSTACWRGYIGTWEIRGNKLFLINIDGSTENGIVDLDYLFPSKKEVFANWYNGELNIPQGDMIEYIHRGHFSIYEKDIIFTFTNGIITKQIIRDNQTKEIQEVNFREILDHNIKEKINNSNFFELVEMFNSALKSLPNIKYEECKNIQLEESNKLYVRIDIKNWNATEKEQLYTSILKGLNIYYFVISDMKSMPIGAFNSVLKAVNGTEYIFINKKSIKWIPKLIKEKIRNQGVEFEDLTSRINKPNFSKNDDLDYGPGVYGYSSWEEMAFYDGFDGDIDAWNHYNQ